MTERGRKPARAPRRQERRDDGRAFLPDPSDGPARVPDDLAELLAEDFITSATSGEEHSEDTHEEEVPEELGGPFIPSSTAEEFANDVDSSNPPDAKRAAFPTSNRLPRPDY